MKILIIRHAIAVEQAQWSGHDQSRPLTDEGVSRMRDVVCGLRKLVRSIDQTFCSPYLRAKQTAELLGKEFPGVKLCELEALAPGGEIAEIQNELSRLDNDCTIALVGHEPDLSLLLAQFLTGEATSFTKLKKGAVALVEVEGNVGPKTAVLQWLLPPRLLCEGRR